MAGGARPPPPRSGRTRRRRRRRSRRCAGRCGAPAGTGAAQTASARHADCGEDVPPGACEHDQELVPCALTSVPRACPPAAHQGVAVIACRHPAAVAQLLRPGRVEPTMSVTIIVSVRWPGRGFRRPPAPGTRSAAERRTCRPCWCGNGMWGCIRSAVRAPVSRLLIMSAMSDRLGWAAEGGRGAQWVPGCRRGWGRLKAGGLVPAVAVPRTAARRCGRRRLPQAPACTPTSGVPGITSPGRVRPPLAPMTTMPSASRCHACRHHHVAEP
jgi:hypothetical protein